MKSQPACSYTGAQLVSLTVLANLTAQSINVTFVTAPQHRKADASGFVLIRPHITSSATY
jgi:hypothetical protein